MEEEEQALIVKLTPVHLVAAVVAVVLTVIQATLVVDTLVDMVLIIQFQHKDLVVVMAGIPKHQQ